ncbi:3D (Asp-Asp-Asp) domain-containing protein [Scopulibacillus darangshiensis]|uniref:3D (Asp-Asp-Asp) domain-containing protein n=1 Tax=Scopulibacillus darangshiensis TaxID=442528 RepID=A0A4R2NVD8_9BACL|nr:LysM peptidoglycan-binding domain-containing protein [Scopulibacillus darangshiensis]TCP25970.1 3D (Asp-Asp-Asp) domain-containing protein [Scopulibacillus darangshiensis]
MALIACLFVTSNVASAHGTYTVEKGDTLSKIARSHNVSLKSVVSANSSIENINLIFPGQAITLPGNKDLTPSETKGKSETFTVTAYTAGTESTGKQPGDAGYGITASGNPVQEGETIACPPSMDFGTKVYIPYFNQTYTCQDRGSAIHEGRIDVYMKDLNDAINFGKKQLKVNVQG